MSKQVDYDFAKKFEDEVADVIGKYALADNGYDNLDKCKMAVIGLSNHTAAMMCNMIGDIKLNYRKQFKDLIVDYTISVMKKTKKEN